jgi:hypothetical protein
MDAGSTGGGSPDSGFTPSPHRPFPVFPEGAGLPLSPLTLVTLVAANDPNAAAWQQFDDEVLVSSWFPVVTQEYGVGAPAGGVHVTVPAITSNLAEAEVIALIAQAIADGGAPQPDGNTLYLIYLPAPFEVSPSFACAYHKGWRTDAGTLTGDGWGVVSQCRTFHGETPVEANIRVGSHEIVEAVTDSLRGYNLGTTPTTPWFSSVWRSYEQSGGVEVGDLCEGTRIFVDGWDFQRSWSNVHAQAGEDPCLPPNPGGYFNVSAPRDWYAAGAGTTVDIPYTGWSTAPRGPWLLNAFLINGSGTMLNLAHDAGYWSNSTALGPTKLATNCKAYPGMNDGASGTLTVVVPATASSGDWVVLGISSFEEDPATCYAPADRDDYHFWPIGLYVP